MPVKETHTTPRQFRLGDQTLQQMDAIGAHYGGLARADVIRLAVRQLHDQLAAAPTAPKKNLRIGKKSG